MSNQMRSKDKVNKSLNKSTNSNPNNRKKAPKNNIKRYESNSVDEEEF